MYDHHSNDVGNISKLTTQSQNLNKKMKSFIFSACFLTFKEVNLMLLVQYSAGIHSGKVTVYNPLHCLLYVIRNNADDCIQGVKRRMPRLII